MGTAFLPSFHASLTRPHCHSVYLSREESERRALLPLPSSLRTLIGDAKFAAAEMPNRKQQIFGPLFMIHSILVKLVNQNLG